MIRLSTNYPTRQIGKSIDYEAVKRNAFRDQGIVVARLDDHRLTEWDRQYLRNIGAKLYGAQRA